MNISTPTEVHAWPSREEGYSPLEYSFTQVFWAERERGERIEGWKGRNEEGWEGKSEGERSDRGQGEGREGWWKVKEENMREEEGGGGRKRRQVTKTSDISLATLPLTDIIAVYI